MAFTNKSIGARVTSDSDVIVILSKALLISMDMSLMGSVLALMVSISPNP